ncbi:uncharacterized MFS-type transporter C09D4.1-like isoform X1 [Bacillus rossius redtenbacheri]|uniref:uncharacterized MFS-type transporter C09D4.1-like isoform X1 n=1 Tax=Bacillus rossius redtenbacheri TaxID=93214 RepID=UPI002FDCE96D
MDYEDESYKLPPESSRLVNAATCTAMALDREVRVYKRRWIMLALFVLCAANITVHWMQFSIIANIVMKYYNVSSSAVNWTSMVYMAAYVLLVVPASWLMDKKGLRVTLACAAGLTAAGAWLKALSASPQRFPVALAGQALLGAAQVFVLGAPAAVAAAWFGPGQVSTATALGVFGIQVGAAVGFVIPPVAVQNHEDADDIGSDLLRLYLGLAAGPSILLLLILLVFQAAPPIPPSPAEASVKSQEKKPAFSKTLGSLLTNKDFMLLLLSYGANMGAFNATSTLLNQILLTYFEGSEADGGRIGLIMILSGMLGSVVGGFVLDKTHKFKETSVTVCAMALLGMIGYTLSFRTGHIVFVYVVVAFLGFFMTSHMTVAFEFAAELTYPLPAATSSGLLNMAAEVSGVALTSIAGRLLAARGDLAADGFLCGLLLAGLGAAALVRGGDLRRQAASLAPSPVSEGDCAASHVDTSDEPAAKLA